MRVHRWNQNGGSDVIAADEAPGLLVVPPIFSIAPYDTALIRLAFRQSQPPRKVEESYQVLMTEITAAQSPPARVITVPLFVRPASISGAASYTLKPSNATGATLFIDNQSNVHVFLSKLTITAGEKTVYKGADTIYVLAGNRRSVPLRLSGAVVGERAELRFESEDGSSQSAQATVSR
ncbi:MAG: molecular chaperone [Candidatus Eremiobacteraeota bacterium]|nr:molecular chaperone [Candidatus Eremiobacteraeota bacterium]